MKVRIIVDSTADLIPSLKEQVDVVPLTVHFGETEYVDGVTITPGEFYKKLSESKELPHTSQATPFAFGEAYEKAVAEGCEVVCITCSSGLSGTFQSAEIAADDYPGKVFVVDSRHIALSSAIMVEYALQLADRGMNAEAIAQELMRVRDKVHLMGVVDTLEYLQKGGRVSKTVAIAGGLLSIKPIIAIEDGVIQMVGKARGNKQANAMMNKEAEKLGIDFSKPFLLGYTGTDDHLLCKYMEENGELWAGHEVHSTIVSAVVGVHAGPGAVAIAFFSK
ncbi:MAG: DegV family protein [Oscillospiraceae bacterium]|nr:DegV family protein [Oscillospiraceae bacterium]